MAVSAKQADGESKLLKLLHDWDAGTPLARVRILRQFIEENRNKTGVELEDRFAGAGSLFFVRLTAWIRMSYLLGTYLADQLRAINVFLSAACGHPYVVEFIEVGGVQTLLELLSVTQAKEVDKREAINVLYSIADYGRRYKELICECYGIRAVAECMAKSESEQTCEAGRRLLHSLAVGNPKFLIQVYKGLVALFSSDSPSAQRMAAMTVRRLQSTVGQLTFNIVDPVLGLLRSLNVEVQVEAAELICELVSYNVRDDLLRALVQLLSPSQDVVERARYSILQDPEAGEIKEPIPVYIQQSGAAHCLGRLVVKSTEIAEQLIQLDAPHYLLCAMANTECTDSQRHSAITLHYLCRIAPQLSEKVLHAVGDQLHSMLLSDPDEVYNELTPALIEILISNKLHTDSQLTPVSNVQSLIQKEESDEF